MNNSFVTLIQNADNFSLVTKPSLALTVFRLVPVSKADGQLALSLESLNELNRLFYGRISARTDIMMTQTNLNGIFCIRFVTGAMRTTEVHVRTAYDILCKEAENTLEMWSQSPRDISIKHYPSSELAVVKATPIPSSSRSRSESLSAALQDVNNRVCYVPSLQVPSPLNMVC